MYHLWQMKKRILFVIFLATAIFSFAQRDTTAPLAPPYLRFPDLPPFRLLRIDSISYFSKADVPKNKPVLLMIFDPNCDHCQHETEDILKNIDSFKNIQIVMSTNASFELLKDFYNKYGLANYKNIVAGVEMQYFLVPFYDVKNLPYLAMYDKKGKLMTTHEGTTKIELVIEAFK
jgi:thioredoxin-related protein